MRVYIYCHDKLVEGSMGGGLVMKYSRTLTSGGVSLSLSTHWPQLSGWGHS